MHEQELTERGKRNGTEYGIFNELKIQTQNQVRLFD